MTTADAKGLPSRHRHPPSRVPQRADPDRDDHRRLTLPGDDRRRRDHRDRVHVARPRAAASSTRSNGRDFPVIMGIALVFAVVVLVANLITDVAYAAADPTDQVLMRRPRRAASSSGRAAASHRVRVATPADAGALPPPPPGDARAVVIIIAAGRGAILAPHESRPCDQDLEPGPPAAEPAHHWFGTDAARRDVLRADARRRSDLPARWARRPALFSTVDRRRRRLRWRVLPPPGLRDHARCRRDHELPAVHPAAARGGVRRAGHLQHHGADRSGDVANSVRGSSAASSCSCARPTTWSPRG